MWQLVLPQNQPKNKDDNVIPKMVFHRHEYLLSIEYERNYKFQFAKLNVGQKSTLKYVRSSKFMIPAEYK